LSIDVLVRHRCTLVACAKAMSRLLVFAAPECRSSVTVHNEGESIEAPIREICDELSSRIQRGVYHLAEDGRQSTTPRTFLARLAKELPLRLNMTGGAERVLSRCPDVCTCSGRYSLPGLRWTCDAKDFGKFWDAREGCDVYMGMASEPCRHVVRRLFPDSSMFLYQMVLHVSRPRPELPICADSAARRAPTRGQLGAMRQGFWWEFVAR